MTRLKQTHTNRNQLKTFGLTTVAVTALTAFAIASNNFLDIDEVTIESPDVPDSADGLTIAHMSDLHDKQAGICTNAILQSLAERQPDLICLTGDIGDPWEARNSIKLIRKFATIAPTFVSLGNHDVMDDVTWLYELERAIRPATLLDAITGRPERLVVTSGGHVANICDAGRDCTWHGDDSIRLAAFSESQIDVIRKGRSGKWFVPNVPYDYGELASWDDGISSFTVLMAHHPEFAETYAEIGAGLVLAGHVHGGLIRMPGVGGLFAPPNQRWLPKYDAGLYVIGHDGTVATGKQSDTASGMPMYVSRGIGNHSIEWHGTKVPFRINDRPELTYVRLKRI